MSELWRAIISEQWHEVSKIIKKIFCIPDYNIDKVDCLPYNETVIDQLKFKNFYTALNYYNCTKIFYDFKLANGSQRLTMKGLFYYEVHKLMRMFCTLSSSEQEKNNFMFFASIFKKPSHFGSNDNNYYIKIKTSLEEIYYILKTSNITTQKRNYIIQNLSRQLVVCGPGIFNSVLNIRQSLSSGDITLWLARYREQLTLDAAAEFKVATYHMYTNLDYYSIHIDALFLMQATLLNFAPLGGELQLKHGDFFVDLVHEKHKIPDNIRRKFANEYKLDKIIYKIKTEFLTSMHNITGNDTEWIEYGVYQNIYEQILQLAKSLGLTNQEDEIYTELLDFSEDYSKCRIRTEIIDYCIMMTLDRLKVISAKFKSAPGDEDCSFIYFTEYDNFLIWHKNKEQVISPCLNKPQALDAILNHEKSNKVVYMATMVEWISEKLYPKLKDENFVNKLLEKTQNNRTFNMDTIIYQIEDLDNHVQHKRLKLG